MNGYCGTTVSQCGAGRCQEQYGDCWATPTPSTSRGYTPSSSRSVTPTPSKGSASPSPVYNGYVRTSCGDGVCENAHAANGETCGNCPWDCGPCQPLADVYECKDYGKYVLTFDGGPTYASTNSIMDTLIAQRVPAAFFVVGMNANDNGGLFEDEMYNDFFTYSNTYSAPYMSDLTPYEVYNELKLTEDVFSDHTCRRPVLFRPPYGDISHDVRAVANRMGYRAIMSAFNTRDDENGIDHPDWVASDLQAYLTQTTPRGVFGLQHDSEGGAGALSTIISTVKSRGYSFVSMEECLWGANYKRNPSWAFMYKDCGRSEVAWPAASTAEPCPVSDWSEWSVCDANCGKGSQTRVRLTLPPGREKSVAACGSRDMVQLRSCQGPTACSSKCVYSAWTRWGQCSQTCGGGTQISTRTVYSGKDCEPAVRVQLCNMQSCFGRLLRGVSDSEADTEESQP